MLHRLMVFFGFNVSHGDALGGILSQFNSARQQLEAFIGTCQEDRLSIYERINGLEKYADEIGSSEVKARKVLHNIETLLGEA